MSPASRLLLDTHVFLWWRGEPSRIAPTARSRIATAAEVFVSVASAWEAAIKSALGRLDLPDTMEAGVLASGFEKLLITFAHAERAAALPRHHRDPFDRMLIAQAQADDLTLVTHNHLLEPYEVSFVWT
ncbi:MAG: type II toxin-antitoxin system VapC family toxin [Acidobacteria bacterium]|nr:type II toxin-antitoxin system VapC family toxin [Acidobacteriota bacterium]